MKGSRASTPGRSRYLASGPLVWVATIVCTTLLLIALKQALWLVVPFLMVLTLPEPQRPVSSSRESPPS